MNDETGNREYKRQLDRDDRFERAVVAFLNSGEGGTIYIGIEDNGSVRGVADPDLVQRQSADRIRNNIRPVALGLFDIGLEEREGIEAIAVCGIDGVVTRDNGDIAAVDIDHGALQPFHGLRDVHGGSVAAVGVADG